MNTLVITDSDWHAHRDVLKQIFPAFTAKLKAMDDLTELSLSLSLQEVVDMLKGGSSQSQQPEGIRRDQFNSLLTVDEPWQQHEDFLYHFFSSRAGNDMICWYTHMEGGEGWRGERRFWGYCPTYFRRKRPVDSLPSELMPEYGRIDGILLPSCSALFGELQTALDWPCVDPDQFDDFGAAITLFLGGRRSMRLPMDTDELLEWFHAQSDYVDDFRLGVELFRAGRQSLEVTKDD